MTKKMIIKGMCFCAGLFIVFLCSSASRQVHVAKIQQQKVLDSGWRQLFNGKDLDGWKQVGPGTRYVENGLTGSHGGMGLCYWTKEKFGDCVIRIVYKMQKENS